MRQRFGFYFVLAAFSLWAIYLHFRHPGVLAWITREDSLAEYASALCYFGAAAIFAIEWHRSRYRNVWMICYALLFLFVGGEEISWGQRILGLETPDALEAINVQNQLTVHNIDGIHQHIRAVGLLVVLGIALVMPVTRRLSRNLAVLYTRLAMPVVPFWTVPLTLLGAFFMAGPRLAWQESVFTFDEIGELYFSLTFLIFALSLRLQGMRDVEQPKPAETLQPAPFMKPMDPAV